MLREYLYRIIGETQPRKFDFIGVEGAAVYTINYKRLAAIVSDTELEVIDPTRQNVRAHTLVQEKLLADYTLLPMGFAMIAGSKEEVRVLLEKNYLGLSQELSRLAGKVEVELKVFWDQEAMLKELQGSSEVLMRLKSRLKTASSSAETNRLLTEVGLIVERTAMNWKTRYADRVYSFLKTMAADTRLNQPLGVKNILNASFLVERTKQVAFQKEVYKLDSQYQGKVNFKYVGPLAPYNFVELKLERAN